MGRKKAKQRGIRTKEKKNDSKATEKEEKRGNEGMKEKKLQMRKVKKGRRVAWRTEKLKKKGETKNLRNQTCRFIDPEWESSPQDLLKKMKRAKVRRLVQKKAVNLVLTKNHSNQKSLLETRVQMKRKVDQRRSIMTIIIMRMINLTVRRSTMGRRKVLDLKNIITMIPGGPKGPEVGVPKVIELTERLRWIERKKKEMLMKKMLLRILLTQDLKQIHPLIKILVVKMRK